MRTITNVFNVYTYDELSDEAKEKMLTITTGKQTIYINTDLLKSRLKSAFITILKASTYILAFAGILWIIGTAGASDNNPIPFTQIFIQLLQGFLCCGIAWVLNFIKLVIE